MKITAFLFFLIALFFLKTSITFAGIYNSSTNTCKGTSATDCTTFDEATGQPIPLSTCQTNTGQPPPPNVCFQVPWTFQYTVCEACPIPAVVGDRCTFDYQFKTNACDSNDRCFGATTGGTGFDPAGPGSQDGGRVVPGICSASSFDGTNPQSACISGGWYKTCCSVGGNYPTTSCSSGVCPQGQITLANVTTCTTAAATPPPPTPPPLCNGTPLNCPNNANPQCPSGYTMVKLTNGNYTCINNSTGNPCDVAPFCPSTCPSTDGWTGQQCTCGSGNIPSTCASRPNECNTCSLTYCLIYQTNICCYWKDPNGACFIRDPDNCKGFGNCGPDKCTPGSIRTTCSAPNVCPATQ